MTTLLDLFDGTQMQLSNGTFLILHFAADIVLNDNQIIADARNTIIEGDPRLTVVEADERNTAIVADTRLTRITADTRITRIAA